MFETKWARTAGAVALVIALRAESAFAADGTLDPSFGNGGTALMSIDGIEGHELRTNAVAALPDGKILLAGSRNLQIQGNPDPHMRATLARMNADGSPDATFGTDANNPGLIVLPDLAPGTGMQYVEAMRVLGDGAIVVAGTCEAFGPTKGFVLKLDADGNFVQTFGTRGQVLVPAIHLHGLAIDSQGRIVTAGDHVGGTPQYRATVLRFTPDGAADTEFGGTGRVDIGQDGVDQLGYGAALGLTVDDRIVVGGSYQVPDPDLIDNYDFSVARLTTTGALDATFAGGGWTTFSIPTTHSGFDGIDQLVVQRDGRIVFTGHYDAGKTGTNVVLGRLAADGTPDATFGDAATAGFRLLELAPSSFNDYAYGLVLQSDGKPVATVSYVSQDKSVFRAARFLADGADDASFGTAGIADVDLAPTGVYSDSQTLTLRNGKPLLVGMVKRDPNSQLVDIGVAQLDNDLIFTHRFDD